VGPGAPGFSQFSGLQALFPAGVSTVFVAGLASAHNQTSNIHETDPDNRVSQTFPRQPFATTPDTRGGTTVVAGVHETGADNRGFQASPRQQFATTPDARGGTTGVADRIFEAPPDDRSNESNK